MAVLIVGAVATAIALGILVGGADSQRAMLTTQSSTQARKLADTCAEEALQQMHDATTFTGTSNITLGQGNCTYTVTSTGANTRTVDTTATVNGVVRKSKVYVTITATSISITSWQEVS